MVLIWCMIDHGLTQHSLSPLFSRHMANTTSPLDHNSHVAVATLAGRRHRHLDPLTRPSSGPPQRHSTHTPLMSQLPPLPFCSHKCYAFNYFMPFSSWALLQKPSPNLNTHHTHNFKCFSSFHFPFSLYFSFYFPTFSYTHITDYHNQQDKEKGKKLKLIGEEVVSGRKRDQDIHVWIDIILYDDLQEKKKKVKMILVLVFEVLSLF